MIEAHVTIKHLFVESLLFLSFDYRFIVTTNILVHEKSVERELLRHVH